MLSQLSTQEPFIPRNMDEYKILSQKVFESTKAFEKRLNEVCHKGWKPISIAAGQGGNTILLQKVERYIG